MHLGLILLLVLTSFSNEMVLIQGGIYKPFSKEYPDEKVANFKLMERPVTNADFLEFVKNNPRYQKSKTSKLLADSNYLRLWNSDLEVSEDLLDVPVVSVSWYAAKAYCNANNMDLPTLAQWEIAADANSYQKEILKWYSTPGNKIDKVYSTFKTKNGLWDIHGLIWEWVLDFDSETAVSSDLNFCGAAVLEATDTTNYTAYLRYGLRTSIKANYTVRNMGFRCAQNL